MTLVGLEKRKDGAKNLLVLDPMYRTSAGLSQLVGTRFRVSNPSRLLQAHRRGNAYLKKYRTFEILKYGLVATLMHHVY